MWQQNDRERGETFPADCVSWHRDGAQAQAPLEFRITCAADGRLRFVFQPYPIGVIPQKQQLLDPVQVYQPRVVDAQKAVGRQHLFQLCQGVLETIFSLRRAGKDPFVACRSEQDLLHLDQLHLVVAAYRQQAQPL